MIYVTDTHGLIWFLSESKSLSNKAREIFENSEKGESTIVIPTIVLAELLHICENKNLIDKFSRIIENIAKGTNHDMYDLNLGVILESRNLTKIPEMHDKIITATARILNAELITKDKEIKNSGYVKTVW